MNEKYKIAYFPYIFNNWDSLEFDGDVLWNISVSRLARKYIPDVTLRKYVRRLLSSNRHRNRRIKNIFIFTAKGKSALDFFDHNEEKRFTDIAKILFLCSVSASNIGKYSHHFATSDNFMSFVQNFTTKDDFTAFRAGRIISILDGGYKIGEIRYEAPYYLLKHGSLFDTFLLEKLEVLKRLNRDSFERIIMATDAMMGGYSNADHVSYEMRILLQSRSFEILFDLPERDQRKHFRDKIKEYCQSDDEHEHDFLTVKGDGKFRQIFGSRQMMWADRFYLLRNQIVHGSKVFKEEYFFYEDSHWHLALLFFIVATKRIVYKELDEINFRDVIRHKSGRLVYDKWRTLTFPSMKEEGNAAN
jgi:hypothetical protein